MEVVSEPISEVTKFGSLCESVKFTSTTGSNVMQAHVN